MEKGSFSFFKKWIVRQKVRLGLAAVLVFMDVALSMQLPYLMSVAVGEAVRPGSGIRIGGLLLRMILLSVGSVLAGFAGSVFLALAAQAFGQELRGDFLSGVLSLPLGAARQFGTGALLTRMVGDTQILSQYLAFLVQSVWRPLLVLGFSLYHIAALGGNLGAWLAGVAVLLAVLFFVMKRLSPWFRRIQIHFERVNSLISRALEALRAIRVGNREETEEMRFARENNELLDLNLKIQSLMALVNPLLMLAVNLSVMAVLYAGGRALRSQTGNIGNVLAMLVYIQQMMMCAVSLGQVFEMTARARISADRVSEVMEQEKERRDAGMPLPEGKLTLELRGAGFSWPREGGPTAKTPVYAFGQGTDRAGDADLVLQDLNAVFPPGSRTGIVGLTGAGKSTLCYLLARFLEPTSGSVCLSGQELGKYSLSSLRAQIGLVPQEAELMPGTISDNIRYGLAAVPAQDVAAAADAAQVGRFARRMEKGLEEEVTQRGQSLSGGQRQCIAVARTLVRRPRILILDDCCTAMDTGTEQALRRGLAAFDPEMTIICVTSRLTDPDWFDRIYVLDQGRIAGEGTHRELLASSPVYREVWETQTDGSASPGMSSAD